MSLPQEPPAKPTATVAQSRRSEKSKVVSGDARSPARPFRENEWAAQAQTAVRKISSAALAEVKVIVIEVDCWIIQSSHCVGISNTNSGGRVGKRR